MSDLDRAEPLRDRRHQMGPERFPLLFQRRVLGFQSTVDVIQRIAPARLAQRGDTAARSVSASFSCGQSTPLSRLRSNARALSSRTSERIGRVNRPKTSTFSLAAGPQVASIASTAAEMAGCS